jgi:hypothetical protein
MVKVALFIRMEAIPSKKAQVEELLTGALRLVREEPTIPAWFGLRVTPRSVSSMFSRAMPQAECICQAGWRPR